MHLPYITVAESALAVAQRTIMAVDAAKELQLSAVAQAARGGFDPFPDTPLTELCTIRAIVGDWDQANYYAKKVFQFHEGGSLPPKDLTGCYETEALLCGGDNDLAQAEVERRAGVVGNNRRSRLSLLRSQAVLAQWDGDVGQAIAHLEAALALAQEIGLPGEAWPIWGDLGKLYAAQGEDVKAQEAYVEAGVIIRRLADTIDDEGLREGYLTAVPAQSILQSGEGV